MKLTNIRNLGKYRNKENMKVYNIKKGQRADNGFDVYFYVVSFKRYVMTDRNFHIIFERI